MDLKTKQKLKKFIANLASVRGRHTELVSVFIPSEYDIFSSPFLMPSLVAPPVSTDSAVIITIS